MSHRKNKYIINYTNVEKNDNIKYNNNENILYCTLLNSSRLAAYKKLILDNNL